MATTQSQELVAVLSVIEHLEGVRNEMDTWAKVQTKIFDTLEAHTVMLEAIAENVGRKPAEDGDPLGELLRKLVINGEAHTEALNNLTTQLIALTKAITERTA